MISCMAYLDCFTRYKPSKSEWPWIWLSKVTQGQIGPCHSTAHIWFLICDKSNHMCIFHLLTVMAVEKTYFLLSLGQNFGHPFFSFLSQKRMVSSLGQREDPPPPLRQIKLSWIVKYFLRYFVNRYKDGHTNRQQHRNKTLAGFKNWRVTLPLLFMRVGNGGIPEVQKSVLPGVWCPERGSMNFFFFFFFCHASICLYAHAGRTSSIFCIKY